MIGRASRWSQIFVAISSLAACADETPHHDSDQEQTESPASSEPVPEPTASAPDAGKAPTPRIDAGLSVPPITTRDAAASTPADAGPSSSASDAATSPDASTPNDVCDRACLIGHTDSYLAALTKNDPMAAPFAPTLRYTDNGKDAKLGDGLWKTASSTRADTRLDFADPVTSNAGVHIVVLEGSTPVIYQARLKVVKGQITELETMTVRRQGAANGFFSPDGMVPKPVFKQTIPPDKRMTRAAISAELDLYVDFLEGASGSKVHFDPMCVRFENGVQTAQAGRVGSQSWNFDVTRRYPIIDEEAGIIWGMLPFSQAATALVVGEAFKVMDSKIMMIQAVMANIPAKAWE